MAFAPTEALPLCRDHHSQKGTEVEEHLHVGEIRLGIGVTTEVEVIEVS